MEKKLKLLPPMMPNFISIERPIGQRQDGFNLNFKIDILELSEEEVVEYGELMKQTFIEHWKNKKNGR